MSRSFVLTTLIVLLSGIGCRTQEPTSGLQESVARLEERLARMDEYLKSMQQQKQEQAQVSKERDLAFANVAQFREELANQKRTYRGMLQQHERLAAEQQQARHEYEQELARLRQRSQAEKREQDARLEKTQREAESLRAQLAKAQETAGRRDGDHKRVLELVADERRQIERLRAAIVEEIEQTERGAGHGDRLRDENERLRDRVATLERELARSRQERATPPAAPPVAAPPGTVVIHNEDGEIHLHFHGAPPSVSMPAVAPPRKSDAAPGSAGPSGPSLRVREAAPRKRAPADEAKDRDDGEDEKRLNYAPPIPVSNLAEVRLGSF